MLPEKKTWSRTLMGIEKNGQQKSSGEGSSVRYRYELVYLVFEASHMSALHCRVTIVNLRVIECHLDPVHSGTVAEAKRRAHLLCTACYALMNWVFKRV